VSPDSLEEKHRFFLQMALQLFSSTKKMGGRDFCDRYKEQLETELMEQWESLKKHNEVTALRKRIKRINVRKILRGFYPFLFVLLFLSVQECFQCLPDTCSAVCPDLPPVCAVRNFVLHWPGNYFLCM